MLGAVRHHRTVQGGEPQLGAIEKISTPSQVSRPIYAYLPSAQQAVGLGQLQLQAANTCLRAKGIQGSYTVSGESFEALAREARSDDVTHSSLWGFFGMDTAATYGYQRPPAQGGGVQMMIPPPGLADQVSSQCQQKSIDALNGQTWNSFLYPFSLPNGGPPVPSTDSRWLAVVSKWSSCMKEQGFNYAGPLDALNDTSFASTASVTPAQIAAATADIQCKISTNMVGIGAALQAAYDQRYIDSHRSELAAFQDTIDSLLRGHG